MNNPFSLEGKTILVTGASSGIGRSVAIVCSGMGAKVVLTARSEKRLQDTMSLLEGQGHRYICADLTNQKDVVNLVSSLPELCGIVHCAGLMKRVPCKMINHDSFSSVFSLNLEAQILLQANLLQEKKISKGGSIVFISSFAAHSAVSGNSLYSASKAALISYANCLALEVAPRRLRVNCVCPAMVWTELVYEGASQEELEYDQNTYPLGRYGKPEDIANLVVYLLSDASVWMTGSCLNITGGKYCL